MADDTDEMVRAGLALLAAYSCGSPDAQAAVEELIESDALVSSMTLTAERLVSSCHAAGCPDPINLAAEASGRILEGVEIQTAALSIAADLQDDSQSRTAEILLDDAYLEPVLVVNSALLMLAAFLAGTSVDVVLSTNGRPSNNADRPPSPSPQILAAGLALPTVYNMLAEQVDDAISAMFPAKAEPAVTGQYLIEFDVTSMLRAAARDEMISHGVRGALAELCGCGDDDPVIERIYSLHYVTPS